MATQIWSYMLIYHPLSKLENVVCDSVAETTICLAEEYCLLVSLISSSSFNSKLEKGIVLSLCLNSIKHNWDMILDQDSYTLHQYKKIVVVIYFYARK